MLYKFFKELKANLYLTVNFECSYFMARTASRQAVLVAGFDGLFRAGSIVFSESKVVVASQVDAFSFATFDHPESPKIVICEQKCFVLEQA